MDIDPLMGFIGLAVLVVGPGGAAWVAVKTGLNGVRSDVADIKKDVREMREHVTGNRERIAKMEGGRDE